MTDEFDIDHFAPQIIAPNQVVKYENLIYACSVCNLRKGKGQLPDPAQGLTAETSRVYPDGTVVGLAADAKRIIRILCLNSPAWKRWRRMWIRIIELAAEHDAELLRKLLGFPEHLPDLKRCRAPHNARPEGVEDSFFARRQRGELPVIQIG